MVVKGGEKFFGLNCFCSKESQTDKVFSNNAWINNRHMWQCFRHPRNACNMPIISVQVKRK